MTGRPGARSVARVGWRTDPVAHHPRPQFRNRFDDREARFRTLYVAAQETTALREVLADRRPDLRAFAQFQADYPAAGERIRSVVADLGRPVTAEWRREHVVARGRLQIDGPIADLADARARQELAVRYAALLTRHDHSQMDLPDAMSRDRRFTREFAARLYDDGHAGVKFRSQYDSQACWALFEGRAEMTHERSVELTDPAPPSLTRVAREWAIDLEPTGRARGRDRGAGLELD